MTTGSPASVFISNNQSKSQLEEESNTRLSSPNWDLLLLLDMNTDAEEPVVTMNLRDFSCYLTWV